MDRAAEIISTVERRRHWPGESLVVEVFGESVLYGQIVKRYKGAPHRDAARRYLPGNVVAVEREVKIGSPPRFLTGTPHIERTNLTVRMSQRRLTRRSNGYSKLFKNHAASVSLLVAHENFLRVHKTSGVTPAMEFEIADHVWSVQLLIQAAERELKTPPGRSAGPFRVIDGGGAQQLVDDRVST